MDAPMPEPRSLADPEDVAPGGLRVERGADCGGEDQVGVVPPDAVGVPFDVPGAVRSTMKAVRASPM